MGRTSLAKPDFVTALAVEVLVEIVEDRFRGSQGKLAPEVETEGLELSSSKAAEEHVADSETGGWQAITVGRPGLRWRGRYEITDILPRTRSARAATVLIPSRIRRHPGGCVAG